MNSPNFPPPGGPQGPYGPPQGQPYGQRPPQTPPGGQPYGGPPPQGPPYGAPPPPPPGGFGPGAPGPGGPVAAPPAAGGFGPPGGPGGAPPAAYPTPPPPAPTAKPSNTGKIIKFAVIGVVIVAAAIFGFLNWGKSAASANVGECIKVNDGSATDADLEKIDCNSAEAVYKVAVTLDNSSGTCPAGDYTTYSQGGRRTADVTLCLMLNAEEGDCFDVTADGDPSTADCASADIQVTKVLDGAKDGSGCPEGTTPQVYPEPKPVVMCLGAPAGASGT